MTILLEARGLAHTHPGGFRLEEISFTLSAGERVALAGPNGAGKSTLLKMLAGALPISRGDISFSGKRFASPLDRARKVAWVPQEIDAPDVMVVEELVGLGLFPRSRFGGWAPPSDGGETIERILSLLALESLRRRPMGTLSGGERRRVLLARGLAQGAHILLLDEPTAHLDPRRQVELVEVLDALRGEGVTVLLATHDLNWALETCGRILFLAEGRLLADGDTMDVVTPGVLEKVYRAPARVSPGPDGRPGHVRWGKQISSVQPQEATP